MKETKLPGPDDVVIVDEEDSWGTQSTSGQLRGLVMDHLKKMSNHVFMTSDPVMTEHKGVAERIDRREIYIQAVDFLHAILQPRYDKTMNEYYATFQTAYNALLLKVHRDAVRQAASDKAGGDMKKYKEWLSYFLQNNITLINKQASYYDEYLELRHILYQQLFAQINFLLDRINWLQEESYAE